MHLQTDPDATGATSATSAIAEPPLALPPQAQPFPLPSLISGSSPLSPGAGVVVLSDPKTVAPLLEQLLSRSGLTVAEVCRRLDCSRSSFNQYRYCRRTRPSVQFLSRVVEVCGGRLMVELPARPLR